MLKNAQIEAVSQLFVEFLPVLSFFNTTNLNLYHYAGNNPVKYLDPDGRTSIGAVFLQIAIYAVAKNMPTKIEHYSRNDKQKQFLFSRVEDAEKAGFQRLGVLTNEDPEKLDNCHENGKGTPSPKENNKYTMQDGNGGSFELVYDSDGNLVTDEVNKGTYNFADPKGVTGKISHGVKDLLPYLLYGNSKDDPTTFEERFMGTIDAPFGKYNMSVDFNKKEAENERIKATEKVLREARVL